MIDRDSSNVQAAAHLAREADAGPDRDVPSRAELAAEAHADREEQYTLAQIETIHDLAIDRAECYVSPEAALRAHERAQRSRPIAVADPPDHVRRRYREGR